VTQKFHSMLYRIWKENRKYDWISFFRKSGKTKEKMCALLGKSHNLSMLMGLLEKIGVEDSLWLVSVLLRRAGPHDGLCKK
jgi:hypothetical protein